MKVRPLWIVLAGGLIVLGIIVDLAVASKLGGHDAGNGEVLQQQQQQQRPSGGGIAGLGSRNELEAARWHEARSAMRAIGDALRLYHARMGSYQGLREGPAVGQPGLGISAATLNLTYFSAQDFRITELRNDGYYELEVRGSLAHSPSGVLRRNARGEESMRSN